MMCAWKKRWGNYTGKRTPIEATHFDIVAMCNESMQRAIAQDLL